MPKIFLSYARIDSDIAKQIYSDLRRYNVNVWFDKESLFPGQKWKKRDPEGYPGLRLFHRAVII